MLSVALGLVPTIAHLSHPTTALASSAYETNVKNDSPLVYYRLNEASGTTATDDSGNGVTGTYHSSGITYGVTGAISGDTDKAISSTGVKTLTASDSTLPTGANARTVEMWIKPDNISPDNKLFLYGSCCTTAAGFEAYFTNGTTLGISGFGTDATSIGTGQSFEDGAWHMLDITYAGGTSVTVYMDGQRIGTATLPQALNTVLGSGLQIGNAEGTNFFSGSMDEFAIYGSALSTTDIQTRWRIGNNISCPTVPTTGYAGSVASDSPTRFSRLGDSSGAAVADYSGNCRTAAYNSGVTHNTSGGLLLNPAGSVASPSSQRTAISDDDNLPSGAGARTVELWMKPASLSSQDLFFYGLCCTSNQGFEATLETSTSIKFSGFGSNTVTFSSLPNFEDGNWHHVALTYDGSTTVKLYLDTVSHTGTLSQSLNTTVPGSGLVIGSGEANNYFSGSLEEFAIYPTALSASRINAHYLASGNTPPPTGGGVSAAQTRANGTNWCVPCHGDMIRHGNMTSFPVSTMDGNFWHVFQDIQLPGRGIAAEVDRTYNANDASTNGPFGYGWQFNYNMSLSLSGTTPNRVATITQENDSQATFNEPASGSSWAASAPRFVATLTHNGDGTWTFQRDARNTYTFNSSGQLTQQKDLNGYTTSLSYTSGNLTTVTDNASRTLTFTWTGSNITKVTDSNVSGNTRTVNYAYDGSGNLTSVTDLNGGITDFAYDASHRMTLMRAPNFHGDGSLGTAPSTCTSTPVSHAVNNHYDASARVDCQWDPKGNKTTFAYTGDPQTATGGTTTTTDPAGNETYDIYQWGLRTSVTKGYTSAVAATTSFQYDPSTLALIGTLDANGNVTSYTVDSNGNVLTVTDPLSRVTTNTYNTLNELLTTQDGNGVTTTNTYDANGNLLTTSRPLTGTTDTATNCKSPSTAVAMAQVTCYTYGDATNPGDVTQVTDPNGKNTYFHYNGNGYRDEVKDPLGHLTGTVLNNDGWITSSYSAKAGCTWNSSPPTGCSATYKTTYDYTIGGSTNEFGDVGTITDPLSHTTKYTYDSNRNTLTVTDGNSNVTTYTYNANDQRCWVLPGGTSTNGCTSVPTNGRATDYNADGTIADQKDGKGNAILTYAYNALDQVTSVTDALSNVTSYTYDGVGNVLTKKDPITGATCSGTKVGCTTYTYDAGNELKTVSYSDSSTENVTSTTYDSDGQRTAMTDGTGSSSWAFDSLHRLTSYTNGNSATVTYGYTYGGGPSYDLKSQVRTIAYPNSVGTVTQSWNDDGTLASTQDWNSKTTSFTYDNNRNLTGQTSPSTTNVTDTFGFNAGDQMTSVSDSNGTTLFSATYTRDSNGQVATDSSVPTTKGNYKYTSLNQLCYGGSANTTACTSPPTGSDAYAFDNADNLMTNNGTAQQYNNADQLCWSVTGTSSNNCATTPTGATTYGFDNKGNRTYKAPAVGSATCYGYDQANLLTSIKTGTGTGCTTPTTVGTYAYDGSGIRESKTVGATTTQFTWDGVGGALLQQYDGTAKTSFIYGPYGPVEQIAGTTTTYLHQDHLGSTRLITDSAGSALTATTITYDPYGNTTTTLGTLTTPLMYTGQYKDSESGLYYVRARHYDPASSMWLTVDPLVSKTMQPYQYVTGNPLNHTDPSGEVAPVVVVVVVIVIGVIIWGATNGNDQQCDLTYGCGDYPPTCKDVQCGPHPTPGASSGGPPTDDTKPGGTKACRSGQCWTKNPGDCGWTQVSQVQGPQLGPPNPGWAYYPPSGSAPATSTPQPALPVYGPSAPPSPRY